MVLDSSKKLNGRVIEYYVNQTGSKTLKISLKIFAFLLKNHYCGDKRINLKINIKIIVTSEAILGSENKLVIQFSSVAQSCPTLCNPMDYTVHRILQARILDWVAIPFSGGSSQPRDQTQVSHTVGGFFTS